jgi:acyl-coenzyme A synthetase/AMP-(fatty) acid ligase
MTWMERQEITLIHTVPTVAQNWIGQIQRKFILPSLRLVFFTGEPLSDTLVRRWRTTFPGEYQIVNLYGPTETTLVKCFFVVPDPPERSAGRQAASRNKQVMNSKARCAV